MNPIHEGNNAVKTSLIQFLLKDRELTHEQIANEQGVSRSSVSEVIRGQCKSEKIERAVARAICLPVQDVFPNRYDAAGELLPRRRRKLNRDFDSAKALSSAYAAMQAQQAAEQVAA